GASAHEVFFGQGAEALRGVDFVGTVAFVIGTDVQLLEVPLLNAVDVQPRSSEPLAVSDSIRVTFSRPLKPTTVTRSTVQLLDAQGNEVVPVLDDGAPASAEQIPVTFTTFGSYLTFKPAAPLTPGATYTLRVHGGHDGVADITTQPLANDYVVT